MVVPPTTHPALPVPRRPVRVVSGRTYGASALLPGAYADLHARAMRSLTREGVGETLVAAELVHEAYLAMASSVDAEWSGPAHFFAVGSRAMHDILIDHLRHCGSIKHGGDCRSLLGDRSAGCDGAAPSYDALDLKAAVLELGRLFPRKAEVVRLCFSDGLNLPEIAEVLQLSPRTVEREWCFARAWLHKRLGGVVWITDG